MNLTPSNWLAVCGSIFLLASATGCGPGMVSSGACPNGACSDPTNPGTGGAGGTAGEGGFAGSGGSSAETPNQNEQPPCVTDDDCLEPYVCHLQAKQCVPAGSENNDRCDPVEGIGCPSGQVCMAELCMNVPGACTNNEDCPIGFICDSGACIPQGGGSANGCIENSDCPGGQICLLGDCKPQQVCNIPHSTNRLQGAWEFESDLKVRDGLQGFTGGLLVVAGSLQKMIDGKLEIAGVPAFLTSLINATVSTLVKEYVPQWGQQIIGWLAEVDDIIDDTHVKSIETFTYAGPDMYVGVSEWTMIEVEYKGQKIQQSPDKIPGLGSVTTGAYSAREVCGTLVMDPHKVNNQIGMIFRWAIEAVLTAVSCSTPDIPCYTGLEPMFNDLIDCDALGEAVQQSTGYSIGGIITAACTLQKNNLVKALLSELDALGANMDYMSLSGTADIDSSDTKLINGNWYGVLGGAMGKGNFEGTFTAQRK